MKDYTGKKKLFIIADAGCDTGFATVTHNLVDELHAHYDISIMGINYYGDHHPIQSKAKLYNPAAFKQGDYYGLERVADLLTKIEPDVILIINDPWVAITYMELMDKYPAPKILYAPVDAIDLDREYVEPLNKFDQVVAYTEFGKKELIHAGLDPNKVMIIPHGINSKLYKPVDMRIARERNGFSNDWFIVNVTARNQIRKRIDLAMYYFSEWVRQTNKPNTVKLHYHGAIEDEGWSILRLARKLKLAGNENTEEDRFIITSPYLNARNGLPLELMPMMYGVANVGFTCTMGEGWDLPTMERMAMKIPMIVPNHSALGDWAYGGVHYMDIADEPFFHTRGLNTRGGIPSKISAIAALDMLYNDADYHAYIAQEGYKIATSSAYHWKVIGSRFNDVFKRIIKNYNANTESDT